MQKQAAAKYHAKYLKTIQLLALATSPDTGFSNSPELAAFTQSFENSPFKQFNIHIQKLGKTREPETKLHKQFKQYN